MHYITASYFAFLLFTIVCYYLAPKRMQHWVLFGCNILFYASFDSWAFIYLGASILTTYLTALLVHKASRQAHKKWILAIGLIINLGALFAIKEYGACAVHVNRLLARVGLPLQLPLFELFAPLGISFYTLTAVAYCVQVYKQNIEPQKNIIKYATYISFFPTIVQGPILEYGPLEAEMFPKEKKKFNGTQFSLGLQLVLWGCFKKLIIADRIAIFADEIFNVVQNYHGYTLVFGAVCYAVQIYTDFSGCVDIVRGSAQMLQINLPQNFKQPYFATSIADFWRRWHITLSSWLRNYVYIPLGGNRKGTVRKYINILVVFLVSGMWHGGGVSYLFWGALHGIYQILGALLKKPREWIARQLGLGAHLPRDTFSVRHKCRKFFQVLCTFCLVTFAWIFFRAHSFNEGLEYVEKMLILDNFGFFFDTSLLQLGLSAKEINVLLVGLAVLFVVEILQTRYSLREKISQMPVFLRWPIYWIGLLMVLIFGVYGRGYAAANFIYGGF